MQNESQPTPGIDPVVDPPAPSPLSTEVPGQPATQAPERRRLLAPIWHTLVMIVILLGNSFFTARFASKVMSGSHSVSGSEKYASYLSSIVLELFLLAILWIGLRIYHTRIRDLIGGRWETPEDFLIDFAIALGFCIVSYVVLAGLSFALGMAKSNQIEESKKLASMLAPHTWGALAIFVLLSCTAGFVEELTFRGYLQRQVGALTGNIYVGAIVSALVFGAGHGYEGVRRMVLIFFFGLMFSALVLWRKNLRSAMIGHALFDAAQGVLLFFITRSGLIHSR